MFGGVKRKTHWKKTEVSKLHEFARNWQATQVGAGLWKNEVLSQDEWHLRGCRIKGVSLQ